MNQGANEIVPFLAVRNLRATVGNGLWVTTLMDPDGYRLDFESPTDEPEYTKWSAGKPGERK